jgi:putative thioredoxin
MSSSTPNINLRGAVDLAALARKSASAPGESSNGFVVDIDDQTFGALVEKSLQVPVLMVFWAEYSPISQQVTEDLVALADEYEGRFVIGRVDIEAAPQVRAALQLQGVPTVLAFVAGQPIPLFSGQASMEQVRPVIDQVLQAAAANGVTGRVAPAAPQPEPEVPALPPLHQKAYDAIEAGDLAAARVAYEAALEENPKDSFAAAGVLQVDLMARTADVDVQAIMAAAADRPTDVAAQLAAADVDLAAGRIDEAFGRLLDLVSKTAGPDRDAARVRLVEFFDIVGPEHASVQASRRRLAMLLY